MSNDQELRRAIHLLRLAADWLDEAKDMNHSAAKVTLMREAVRNTEAAMTVLEKFK